MLEELNELIHVMCLEKCLVYIKYTTLHTADKKQHSWWVSDIIKYQLPFPHLTPGNPDTNYSLVFTY